MKKALLFSFFLFLCCGSFAYAEDAVKTDSSSYRSPKTHAEINAYRPKNLQEAFSRFEQQLQDIKTPSKSFTTVTNRPTGRMYHDDLTVTEKTGVIWDIDIGVQSPEFAEKHKTPAYLTMELPKGVGRMGYSQITQGSRVECLFKLALDKEIFPKPNSKNAMTRGYSDHSSIQVYNNFDGKTSNFGGPAWIYNTKIGPRSNLNNGFLNMGNISLNLRLYANDLYEEYDFYVIGNSCDKASVPILMKDDPVIFLQNAPSNTSTSSDKDFYIVPIPPKFLKMIIHFMSQIEK